MMTCCPPASPPDWLCNCTAAIDATVEFSCSMGLVMPVPRRLSDPPLVGAPVLQHIPITLWPSQLPRSMHHNVLQLQYAFCALAATICSDPTDEFLRSAFASIAKHDSFVANLCALLDVPRSRAKSLGIFRNDFMLHEAHAGPDAPLLIKQVELNTIASAFPMLAPRIARVHRQVGLSFASCCCIVSCAHTGTSDITPHNPCQQPHGASHRLALVPAFDSDKIVPRDIAAALIGNTPVMELVGRWHAKTLEPSHLVPVQLAPCGAAAGAGRRPCGSNSGAHPCASNTSLELLQSPADTAMKPVVLFLVQKGDRNYADQRLLHRAIDEQLSSHELASQVLRVDLLTFAERSLLVKDQTTGDTHLLIQMTADTLGVVGVAYFRATYTPADYLPTTYDPPGSVTSSYLWGARAAIEASCAIGCPSVRLQLYGAKRVQQLLSAPCVLEKVVALAMPQLEPLLDRQNTGSEVDVVRETSSALLSLMCAQHSIGDAIDCEMNSDAKAQAAARDRIVCGFREDDFVALAEPWSLLRVKLMENPLKWVLKPQREGGGTLIADEQVPEFVKATDSLLGILQGTRVDLTEHALLSQLPQKWDDPRSYIAMERIACPVRNGVVVTEGLGKAGEIINEFGYYSTVLVPPAPRIPSFESPRCAAEKKKSTGDVAAPAPTSSLLISHHNAGMLVRTKLRVFADGGVASGVASLDSAILSD